MKCLVLNIRCLRPDFLGCYGNDWLATPAFDQLAAEGVVFDQHFVDEFGTEPQSFLNQLAKQGISTLMVKKDFASLSKRVDQLSDRDGWLLWAEVGSLVPPWNSADYDAEALVGLDEEALEPMFDPPIGEVGKQVLLDDLPRLAATYAGMVSGVDRRLAELVERLQETGVYEELLFIVTSNCGLALGEHGAVGDIQSCLHEECVHLPLLLRMPGRKETGRRVRFLTQTSDLLPTLCQAYEMAVLKDDQGESLLPLINAEPPTWRTSIVVRSEEERLVRTADWHLIVPSGESSQQQRRLYAKPEDRWEVNNLADQFPELADQLEYNHPVGPPKSEPEA